MRHQRRHCPVIRAALLVMALMAGLAGANVARATPVPPGTAFVSTAHASYIDGATGISVHLTSNTVITTVQAFTAQQLSANRTVTAATLGNVVLAHRLTNTGDGTASYALSAAPSGTGFAANGLTLVEDDNGNGVADSGEPTLANGAVVSLAPGASVNLLILCSVPAGATPGQSTQILLSARVQPQGSTVTNTDTITVVGPLVSVTKSASTAAPAPGATVDYVLSARNAGNGAASPYATTVNGQATSLFLLRDTVPANTTFTASTSGTAGAQVLYHRLGDPPNAYVTAAPAATAVDGVAWGVPTLSPGGAVSGTLAVTVNGNAAGTLVNTAYADLDNPGAVTVASNAIVLPLPPLAPTITFYTSNTYTIPTVQVALNAPLYVQINAAQCNTDRSATLTHALTLVSALTGDTESFTATETAPNTGMFRIGPYVPTANSATHVVASGDGILEYADDDHVTATLTGCGVTVSTTLLIDPAGVVFNSKTNAVVAGAVVTLIDVTGAGNGGRAGTAARVFAADGVTAAPSTVTTASTGAYHFPFVPPSTYRLAVVPPNGLSFPSKLAPTALPAGRDIAAQGSYGGNFAVTAATGPIITDIPVDPGPANGLFVQKIASKSVAAIGDFVDYSVTVNNDTGIALGTLVLDDELPTGFAFVPGSARLNGTPLGNPSGGSGPRLAFGLGSLAVGTQSLVTYRVRIGPAGGSGTGTNTAQVSTGPTRSNIAAVTVKVAGSALSDKAYIVGKVYADCNLDGVQQPGEPGIPDIRIYLDNGTYAITDIEGKYSIYGLTPRTHVAKLDTTTLPPGAVLQILGNRNALDPGSRFVDVRNGELQKADFAISNCSAALDRELEARRDAQGGARSEIALLGASQINVNAVTVADPRTLSASGVIGQRVSAAAPGSVSAPGTAGTPARIASATPAAKSQPAPTEQTLADQLPTLTPELAFLNVIEGQVIPTGQTRVRVKGALGTQFQLSVNGRAIGPSQVGERSSLESRGVTAWEFVGVDLDAGDNLLVLAAIDPFGNVRDTRRLHLTAPGKLAKLAIIAPARSASGVQQPLEIAVELQDAGGVLVFSRTELTLESTVGEWQTPDLDPKQPGIQVYVEGGVGHLKLMPPADPGRGRLRITTGRLSAEADITFMPNLRPMLAAGIAEGVLSLHNLNPSSLVASQSGDAFEREIDSASRSFDNGRADAAARASLFLKGKILGSTLLTMSFDSDKPNDTPLFRDIQPDQFYPVYGDSSVKGFDAQSTGKLYVRIDHGTSNGVYGDFSTQSDNPARLLTQYSRALNGVKTHLEEGKLTLDGFASYTSSTQVIDELPANGTSGPYQLSQHDPVVNSQTVDIITRDRDQPSLVLSDTPLAAFTDYAVEVFSGQILLKAPVPSLDANLNPMYIRVAYEVSNGGPKYWVGGVDVREKLAKDLTTGGVLIRDTNPVTKQTLGGVDFLWSPNHDTSLVGEVAETQSDLVGSGGAHRLELKHTDTRVQARVYAVQTDSTFNNPSSTYTAGAAEYGAKISASFDAKNRVVIDALKTSTSGTTLQTPLSIPLVGVPETVAGGGSRQGESIALEHTLLKNLKLTTGVRHVESNGIATQTLAVGAVPNDFTSFRIRLDAPVPAVPKAGVFTQYEQAIDDGGARDVTVGGTYQAAAQTKFYATHQTSNSLSGDYGLNSTQQSDLTVVGIDTTYMQDGKMFDEYRVGDGIDGRDARAAVGLRNLWSLAPGFGLSTSIQQVHPISGVVTDKATALTAALEYTASSAWKGATRAEWSRSTTSETWLTSIGGAVKINPDLTALARGIYNEQLGIGVGATSNLLAQEQLGFALRPVASDVWNALAWVEHKRTDNGTLGPGLNIDEAANIFSTHVNYQPTADWVITGRYGIKEAIDYASGLDSAYTAQIVGARSVWDVTSHWDVGVQYFIEFGGDGLASRQQAIGGEVGYLVIKNLWLSIGYNIVGFTDKDLASEDYTQRAFYLRLRFKFDENLFKPSHNAETLPANTAAMQ